MTTWGAELHKDTNSVKTAASYGDRGDTVNDWFTYYRDLLVEAGVGAVDDAAAPTGDGSAIALLKAIRDAGTALGGDLPENAYSVGKVADLFPSITPCIVHTISVTSTNVADQFCMIFDVTGTAPANGSTPVMCFILLAGKTVQIEYTRGRAFTNGMYICNSTTGATKTLGAADCWYDIQFNR